MAVKAAKKSPPKFIYLVVEEGNWDYDVETFSNEAELLEWAKEENEYRLGMMNIYKVAVGELVELQVTVPEPVLTVKS